jgi:lipopolysaccharide export LptBFGC system permease protein LptF
MKFIKRLDLFILGNFLTLFAGTFCISLFVVMMQFLWKYIDELVGKGLTFDVYVQFFFYAAETLVPLALPLAILLASLISFGNIGERLELLAIKAAGISLFRTLRPLIILISLFALASFHFQNKIVPDAQLKLTQLLYSMKTKSPELEIPEGVFYDGIRDINLFVEKKNKETGMLYDVVIYNMQEGVNNAHIILADSAKLETASDKMHLLLHLYQGELFENLQSGALKTRNVPYRRETFAEKHFIIDFDTNFNMTDEENVSGSARTKSMEQLVHDIDSMETHHDSLSIAFAHNMQRGNLSIPHKARISDYDSVTVSHMRDSVKRILQEEEQAFIAHKEIAAREKPESSVSMEALLDSVDNLTMQRVMKKIVSLIRKYDCAKHVYFMISHDGVIKQFKQYAPDIAMCVGHLDERPWEIVERAIEMKCEKVQLFKPYFNQETVDKAHAHGIKCNVFFADEIDEAKKYIEMGIDTILTNDYLKISSALKIK